MDDLTPGKLIVNVTLCLGLLTGLFVSKYVLADVAGRHLKKQVKTRTIPMAVADLKPGMVVTTHDLGMGPWRQDEIVGDILLGTQVIVGRVVKTEIISGTPIHGSSLYRSGEYSKDYIGVP